MLAKNVTNPRFGSKRTFLVLVVLLVLTSLIFPNISQAEKIPWNFSATTEEEEDLHERIVDSILNYIILCKRRIDKKEMLYSSCRFAPEGCRNRIETFVQYIIEAGKTNNVDPWLTAAIISVESGFNPFAVGAVGERGLMQLNPKTRRGKRCKFVNNERYRNKCKRMLGNCQKEIIDLGVEQLKKSIEKCESRLRLGLSMYNTGFCSTNKIKYIWKVLKAFRTLKHNNGKRNDIDWCSRPTKKYKKKK